MSSEQHFKAVITRVGTRVLLPIPFDPNEVWGAKQRHHIRGRVDGCEVRGALEFDGAQYFLPVGPAWRRDRGIDAGHSVDVVLEPEGPLVETVAPDIGDALRADAKARAFFESLPSFYRKNFVRWIESAKRAETRSARVAEMMKLLRAEVREK